MDRHGLPLSVSTHAANHHEVTLVQLSFDFYMLESKPENLIGDKAYDSNALDESLKQQGVEMIARHPSNQQLRRSACKHSAQGPKLSPNMGSPLFDSARDASS